MEESRHTPANANDLEKAAQESEESMQTDTNTDNFEETTTEDGERNLPDLPPPQYAEQRQQGSTRHASPDTPYPLVTKLAMQPIHARRNRIHWMLVQIVAVTFSTDIDSLKKTLVEGGHEWRETLSEEHSSTFSTNVGKALVAETCALVRTLEKELVRNRWLLVHPSHKRLLRKMVAEPGYALDLNLDFALELLGRFKLGPDVPQPQNTLLRYWMKSPQRTDFGDAIASHGLFVQSLDLKEEPRRAMEDSIAAFQKDNGLEEPKTSKELQEESLTSGKTCCWPLSDGYMALAKALRNLTAECVIHDPYGPSRMRLRASRKRERNSPVNDKKSLPKKTKPQLKDKAMQFACRVLVKSMRTLAVALEAIADAIDGESNPNPCHRQRTNPSPPKSCLNFSRVTEVGV